MAKNTYLNNAADSKSEDMIRSITQFGCAEIHAKTLYEKAMAELENGLIEVDNADVLSEHLDKIELISEEMETYANLRRKAMLSLYNMYGSGDKEYWCLVKHLSIGAMCAFEAYEGSDNDPELLDLAKEANKAFVQAVSVFIGAEVTDCAACLGDFLKASEV